MSKKTNKSSASTPISRCSSTSTSLSTLNNDTISEFREAVRSLPLYQTYHLRTDDAFLLRFLKTAKNNLKKALKRYQAYYQLIVNLPRSQEFTSGSVQDRQWLHDLRTHLDTEIMKNNNYPSFGYYGTDKKGRAIIGFEASTCEPFLHLENYLDACLYLSIVVFDYILEHYDSCQDNGFVMIDDWHGLSFKMFKFFMSNRTFVSNFSALISGSLPMRINQYYIVNGPKLMNVMYNAFKIFLSEKIKSRMFFAGSVGVVADDIGVESVPVFLKNGVRSHVDLTQIDLEEQLGKIFPRKRGL